MINFELVLALVSFYTVMFITPGPNNAMLTASGIKFGFKRTIPHLIGIPTGHIFQIALMCLGLGKIFQTYPFIQEYLKYICAVYLLYLGYKIIGSFKNINNEKSRPLKLYEASLFQIVNPKAWAISSSAAVGFFPRGENLILAVLFMSLIGFIVCLPSITVWALFGSSIRSIIKNNYIKKIIEYFMALLLLLTSVYIIIY